MLCRRSLLAAVYIRGEEGSTQYRVAKRGRTANKHKI